MNASVWMKGSCHGRMRPSETIGGLTGALTKWPNANSKRDPCERSIGRSCLPVASGKLCSVCCFLSLCVWKLSDSGATLSFPVALAPFSNSNIAFSPSVIPLCLPFSCSGRQSINLLPKRFCAQMNLSLTPQLKANFTHLRVLLPFWPFGFLVKLSLGMVWLRLGFGFRFRGSCW